MRARPKLSPSALSLGPGAVLTPLLLPAVALPAAEQFRFDTSFQTYDESAGRMYVGSYYYRGEMFLSEDTSFRFQLLRDAISGSTPIGALPGGTQPFLVEIDDVRTGVLAALSQQMGDHRVELEVSNSQERDYLSQGIALSDKWELNQKNTTLNLGLNFLNDTIVVRGTDDQNKKSYDAFLGFSQLLDKNTILSANLTVGYAEGFLNDQYKVIQRNELVTPQQGQPYISNRIYRENRPSSRLRGILQFQGTHYFRKTNSALDAVLRFGEDDFGISSQTVQVEWRQGLFKKRVEVTPFFRYYQQTAADFFHNTLNEVDIGTPALHPDGSGPNYSADYRLSSMATMSVGLKTRLRLTKNLNASLTYEHYDMSGIGSDQAPDQAYPTASMWTLGLNFLF
ncbi:DUF3570 domain-containing protein [Brevifollis gellanilyticus]|uniref:DUF3570 domain-containing protein n=1 Tax=Brevifollis gellanilyticus TaxID=748831 RepID=A0A512M337_9BACT|nr:DUF3570 domain-containing protein [Brevifollis gellanilyticus]GEP40731.1 hypothetical protein BGE01nite_00220 [Brevifollis gellanilyticus]